MELIGEFQAREKRSVGKAQVYIGQLKEELMDISEGGLCFRTREDHQTQVSDIQDISVEFDNPSDVKLFMSAKVCRNSWDNDNECFLVGLQFQTIRGTGKDELKDLINQLGERESSWDIEFEL